LRTVQWSLAVANASCKHSDRALVSLAITEQIAAWLSQERRSNPFVAQVYRSLVLGWGWMTAATVKLKSCIIVPFVAINTTLNHRLRAGRARTRSVHKKITRFQLALSAPHTVLVQQHGKQPGNWRGWCYAHVRSEENTASHTHTRSRTSDQLGWILLIWTCDRPACGWY
jgi:hypothetical protein